MAPTLHQLQHLLHYISCLFISQTPMVNPDGTAKGLKRLKQTHSPRLVFPLLYFVTSTLIHSSGAHTLRNDFLPVEDEGHF